MSTCGNGVIGCGGKFGFSALKNNCDICRRSSDLIWAGSLLIRSIQLSRNTASVVLGGGFSQQDTDTEDAFFCRYSLNDFPKSSDFCLFTPRGRDVVIGGAVGSVIGLMLSRRVEVAENGLWLKVRKT